jgi:diphthine-ammonia ligase
MTTQRDTTPTLFLTVKGLPKDALIEKQVLYHTGRVSAGDEDGDNMPVSCPPIYGSGISQSFPILAIHTVLI